MMIKVGSSKRFLTAKFSIYETLHLSLSVRKLKLDWLDLSLLPKMFFHISLLEFLFSRGYGSLIEALLFPNLVTGMRLILQQQKDTLSFSIWYEKRNRVTQERYLRCLPKHLTPLPRSKQMKIPR